MKYSESIDGVTYDSLNGGLEYPKRVINVSLSSGIEVKRGDLLMQTSDGMYNYATGSGTGEYGIATGTDSQIASVYDSGLFNRNAINVGSDVKIEEIESDLKKQGIYLTKIV